MGSSIVLVAQGDVHVASGMVSALHRSGYSVLSAGTGAEALEAIVHRAVDLLIVDAGLPGIDGFEVCERVRSGGSVLPIILVNAGDSMDDRIRALTIGGDDYLAIPCSMDELVVRVGVILRRTGRATG